MIPKNQSALSASVPSKSKMARRPALIIAR
jgi:hypothetical protein